MYLPKYFRAASEIAYYSVGTALEFTSRLIKKKYVLHPQFYHDDLKHLLHSLS